MTLTEGERSSVRSLFQKLTAKSKYLDAKMKIKIKERTPEQSKEKKSVNFVIHQSKRAGVVVQMVVFERRFLRFSVLIWQMMVFVQ